MLGEVVYFNSFRKYGIIERKIPVDGGGYFIERYFLSLKRVSFCGLAEPQVGCYVEFEPSNRPPKKEQDMPFACNIFVYTSPKQAEEIKALMAAKPKVGAQQ
jgi:hypothetical protein